MTTGAASPSLRSTVATIGIVASIVLALAARGYIVRVDTDTAIAELMYFGSTLTAAIALLTAAGATDALSRRVGATACVVSTVQLLASRLTDQEEPLRGYRLELHGWPNAAATCSALLVGAAGVVLLTRSAARDGRTWRAVALAGAVAGVAISAGFGIDRVWREEAVGDDAVETRLVLNSNWWLIAAYVLLAGGAWFGSALCARWCHRRPSA